MMLLTALGNLIMSVKGMFFGPIAGSLFLFYHLHPILSLYECIAGGITLGYCIAAWLAYICCAIGGGTSFIAVRISYTILTLITVYYGYKLYKSNQQISLNPSLILLRRQIFGELWLNILIIITSIFFWRVFYIHTLYMDVNGNTWSGGSTWSDLSFHLNVINSYLFGQVRKSLFFKILTINKYYKWTFNINLFLQMHNVTKIFLQNIFHCYKFIFFKINNNEYRKYYE